MFTTFFSFVPSLKNFEMIFHVEGLLSCWKTSESCFISFHFMFALDSLFFSFSISMKNLDWISGVYVFRGWFPLIRRPVVEQLIMRWKYFTMLFSKANTNAIWSLTLDCPWCISTIVWLQFNRYFHELF